jgi:hypothetical protein
MKSHSEFAFLLAQYQQEQEWAEARQHRLVSAARGSRSQRHIRGAFGRSLIRVGQRLSGPEASFEPARQR